jgi:hypothetical protein
MRQGALRFTTVLAFSALVVGCAPADTPAEDAMEPVEEAVAMATMTDFAGSWEGEAMVEGSTDPVPYQMTVNPDGESMMSLPDRENIPLSVSMSGDSMIVVTAEYESVLREGVMVVNRVASVLSDGMIRGNMVATYAMPDGQQLVSGTTTGSRVP